ncbi:Transposase protein, partial [Popillia japonica]
MFILPSKSTLLRYLHAIPFDTGVNAHIFEKLTSQVSRLMEIDRYCILMFDEMSLSRGFDYCKRYDKVLGYADFGCSRRFNKLADHALVFMVQGLRSSWKQPVAYYFTPSSLCASSLKGLITEVISSLQRINLKVVCTVCDQSSVNSSALSQLAMDSRNRLDEDYLFSVKGETIVSLFDVPHLLKNTRTTLSNYNIFDSRYLYQKAKFSFIKQCYELDKSRRFQMLRKLKDDFFNMRNNSMKMKVGIAAKTLSFTVAAAIETM